MDDLAGLAARHAPRPPAGLVLARAAAGGAPEVARSGPVSPSDRFELGSVTKAVTGLLLADAVVRGEVALDTPLCECLPGARHGITLGALATHTAGLPRVPLALLRRAGFLNTTDPYRDTTVDELVGDLAGVRVRCAGRPRYSNLGAALLGQALAARAGAPYEALAIERVLAPLGVELGFDGPVAQPHTRRGRPTPPWALGAYAPAGALRGPVGGALGLAAACLAPPPELAEAVALALTPHARRGSVEHGLGWIRSPLAKGVRAWWHDGGTGGSRAFVGFDPQARVAVAALANSARPVDRAGASALRS